MWFLFFVIVDYKIMFFIWLEFLFDYKFLFEFFVVFIGVWYFFCGLLENRLIFKGIFKESV